MERSRKRAQISSWNVKRRTAPSTGPQMVPLPPKSTMTIMVMVVTSGKTEIGSM